MGKDAYNYWYTGEDILELLEKNNNGNYRIIAPTVNNFRDLRNANIAAALEELVASGGVEAVLMPIHINGNHWTSLVFRLQDGQIQAFYNDSFGDMIPPSLRGSIENLGIAVTDYQIRQQYNGYDCGPWTVQNLN